MNPVHRKKSRRVFPARRVTSVLAVAAVLAGTIVAQSPSASAATEVDFTDFPGTFTSADGKTGVEGTELAVDNHVETKYLTLANQGWLQKFGSPAVVTRYAITSANDLPARDPKNWTLQGSNNGTTFTTLDTRSNQQFSGRFQERSFSVTNSTAYTYYRLNISANNGDGFTQLSEFQLFGLSDTLAPVAAPVSLTANAVRGDQVVLSWAVGRTHRGAFDIERSTDGQTWSALSGAVNLGARFRDYTASPSTAYQYRVRARVGSRLSSWTTVQVTTPAIVTPQTVYDPTHNKPMTLRYPTSDVAIYVEPGRSDPDAQWSYPEIERVWKYVKQHYPGIGTDRLQVLMFEPMGGGTPHYRYDAPTKYQTTIEIGWYPSYLYKPDESRLDVAIHEIGHLVEGWNAKVGGSPEFGAIWGDSAWCDFFMYDVYMGLGLTADANRIYNVRNAQGDPFPRAGTYWFRDWFMPIWTNYGHTDVLNRYFELVRAQYPQFDQMQDKSMNFGEFVHFWSGAAGADLKSVATTAFGWPAEYQAQLEQARIDFPGVTYPHS